MVRVKINNPTNERVIIADLGVFEVGTHGYNLTEEQLVKALMTNILTKEYDDEEPVAEVKISKKSNNKKEA